MASRTRSGAPSPSPFVPRNQYQKNQWSTPSDIDWTNVPFGPHEIPEGRWGKNKAGDHYISCPDGTYHYFNADGSYYHRQSRPGASNAPPASVYISPRSERFTTPAEEDLGEGEYFIGRNWRTGVENIYWEHADGRIVRSFRKNVDLEKKRLSYDYVAVDARYRPSIVDRNGNPIARRTRMANIEGRGVSGRSQSQAQAVVSSPPPRESKEGGCCICM